MQLMGPLRVEFLRLERTPTTMPPEHKPTQKDRGKVEAWVASGATQDTIAKLLGISVPTLEKHYRTELDDGMNLANAKIAGKLYEAADKGCPIRQMFWLKCRARWKERHEVELKGKLTFSDYVAQFSEEDLESDD